MPLRAEEHLEFNVLLTHKLCSVLSGLPFVLQVFVLAPQQAASTLKTGCVFHTLVYI